MDDVVRMGKALYLGASSMPAWRFAKMLFRADQLKLSRFVAMQNHYNVIYREEEREMMPLCRDQGIGVIPYSPLARGFVAGNRQRLGAGDTLRSKADEYSKRLYYQDSDFAVVDCITGIAEKRGVSNAQIALGWLLGQTGVTAPIIGATKMQHLEEAVAAIDVELSEAELTALSDAYVPHPVLNL